jgi:hypothetical protein
MRSSSTFPKAMAWDRTSLLGLLPTTGCEAIGHEIPYARPAVISERNGVKVSSFPAIHGLNGAVGYKLEYAGPTVVFSGDTKPCQCVTDAAAGADLLIHEKLPDPAVAAKALGLPTKSRMAALWHLDIRSRSCRCPRGRRCALRRRRRGLPGPNCLQHHG